jgi:LmbE family N-acetylglucosaminyl deacetylase
MLKLHLDYTAKRKYKILLLGSHCDDIEIGCGGTLLKLVKQIKQPEIFWVVMSSDNRRKKEALASARAFLESVKLKKIVIKDFKNGFFPFAGSEIKEYFEKLKNTISPDLIFTHYRHDLHQDHRLISDLTWNTFRDHLILEYEIPKYDGDLASPNLYVHLDEAICKKKVEKLLMYFNSQREKGWFSEDLFFSIMRIRGIESNAPTKFAEAFYTRKMVI